MARPTITAEHFDQVAAHCGRWAEKNLAIARALIIEGTQLADVAAQFDCTAQHANAIRSRFYDKAQAVRLAAFKQQVNPDVLAELKPYGSDIIKLAADGIDHNQLVDYLKQHGVDVSTETVRKYLEGQT